MPPGAWLAKPSSVADTKITASVTKPICGSSGIKTHMAKAQQLRSTVPMAICNSVEGPSGRAKRSARFTFDEMVALGALHRNGTRQDRARSRKVRL
jgi:hypothetical protein